MNPYLHKKTIGLFEKTKGKISKPLLGGLGVILSFHRCLPLLNLKTYNGGIISPEYLEKIIIYLKDKNIDIISLDEVSERIKRGKSKRQFVSLTFDDGYKDNLIYAYPILQKHHVPFTIFVSTSFPDKNLILYWEALEHKLILSTSLYYESKGIKQKLITNTENEKIAAFHILCSWIKESKSREEVIQKLTSIEAYDPVQMKKWNDEQALSWNELRILNNDSLVTIGAHTVNHLALSKLSDIGMQNEIILSKQKIEEELKIRVDHFAYPNGSQNECNEREFLGVKSAGFKTAVTVRLGNIYKNHASYMHALPRMAIGENDSYERIDQMLNGIRHFSFNEFKYILNKY